MARTRLESYLRTKGYNADVMARIGRIAADMHDPYSAGRFWLLSSAEGPEVDAAIDLLVGRLRREPLRICDEMPMVARLVTLDDYPPIVRERVDRLNLGKHLHRVPRSRTPAPTTLRSRIVGAIVIVLAVAVLLLAASSCVGTIVKWVFG